MGFLLILVGIAILILGPLLVIWALNTLFALGIAYTISTWFATLVLSSIVGGAASASRSSS